MIVCFSHIPIFTITFLACLLQLLNTMPRTIPRGQIMGTEQIIITNHANRTRVAGLDKKRTLIHYDEESIHSRMEKNSIYNGEIKSLRPELNAVFVRYDKDKKDIPIVKQILKFWQFEPNEYEDCSPDLHFSDEEIEKGESIIKKYVFSVGFFAAEFRNS